MADDQYRTQSSGGADWLNKWGLYNKLSTLMDRKRHEWVRSLLYPVIGTLKMEPELTSTLITTTINKVRPFFLLIIYSNILLVTHARPYLCRWCS